MAARPPALSWGLAVLIVVELIGSTFGAPLLFSLCFFASVVVLLFRLGAVPGYPCARRWRRLAGGLALGLGLVAVWVGLPHPGAPELPQLSSGLRLALAASGCAGSAVGVAWCAARRAGWRDLERFGCLLAAAFAWLLVSGHHVQRLAVFPDSASARSLALVGVCLLLALAATAGRWHRARLFVLLGVGISLRVLGLGVWQPDPSVRDMLPLVQAAGDALARGDSPYGLHAMQRGSVVPLTYLPGLWLLHNLPRVIELPLRATSVLADAAVVLGFWWAASGARDLGLWRARCFAFGLAALWLLSPSVQWNAIYAEPHPYWGLLALLCAASARQHFTLAGVLLGLSLATRQFAWVIAPFWLVWTVRELGWVRALEKLSIAGVVALVLLVPFVAVDADAFWFGTLRWFTDYGRAHRAWFLERLGFAGSFYAAHLEGWLLPCAAAAAAAGLGLASRASTPRALASVMAATYTLVIMLCPVIWSSFYLGCFVVIGMTMFVAPVFRRHAAEQPSGLRYWFPFGFASAGLCWLAYSSWRAGSEAGLTQARHALVQQARASDVLVDRGKLRVAFIQPPLFEAAPPVRVVASEFDPSLPDLGVLGAPRAGLLFRESRGAELAQALQQLGPVVDQGRSGRYRWLLVEPAPVVALLPTGLSGGAFRSSGQVFPLEAGELGFAPRVPSVIDVRDTRCLVAGRSRRMLFAHPSDQGELELTFLAPARARRLVLLAGLDDRVVRWGRAEVEVRVFFGDTLAGQLRVRNLPGMQWAVFSRVRAGSQRLKLGITTPDDRQRWLCVDGAWL